MGTIVLALFLDETWNTSLIDDLPGTNTCKILWIMKTPPLLLHTTTYSRYSIQRERQHGRVTAKLLSISAQSGQGSVSYFHDTSPK